MKYYFALVPVTAPDYANWERKRIRIQIHNLANQNALRCRLAVNHFANLQQPMGSSLRSSQSCLVFFLSVNDVLLHQHIFTEIRNYLTRNLYDLMYFVR